MGVTETIDVALASRGRKGAACIGASLVGTMFLLDAAVQVCLRLAPMLVGHQNTSWSGAGLVEGASRFSDDTVDCFLLFLIRAVLLTVLIVVAVRVGTPRLDDLVEESNTEAATTAPLLINGTSTSPAAPVCEPVAPPAGSGWARGEHLESFKRKKAADSKKNCAIGGIFALAMGSQIFVGIKCVSFHGIWSSSTPTMTLQGILLGATVGLINLESWLATRLVTALTSEVGFLVPEFHQHRLFFHGNMPDHYCDMCRSTSKHMYRCTICDFDACPACFNRKDKATGEGVMRGDKGVRDVLEIGRVAYLLRGMRMVAPHMPLLLMALAALVFNSLINVFLPKLQGNIFDRVIDASHACSSLTEPAKCSASRHSFFNNVATYLGLSVALGLLSVVRSLSFQVVARRIAIYVRRKLFRKLLRQDSEQSGIRTHATAGRIPAVSRAGSGRTPPPPR